MTRRCNLKIKQFRPLKFFLVPALLLITSHALYAQISPPFPPLFFEEQTSGTEGTMLPGSEWTS
ncbi:MAG: hypothetical protein AABY66_07210, partial [Nitrospirota bacterium]